MKKTLLLLIILFLFPINSSNAIDLSGNRDDYIKLYEKLVVKYPNTFSKQAKLSKINYKIDKIIDKKTGDKKEFLEFLYEANSSRIEFLKFKNRHSNFEIKSSKIYSEVQKLKKSGIKFIKIDGNQEFPNNGEISRLRFTKYFKIVPNSARALSSQKGVVTNLGDEYIFILDEDYSIETKLPYYKISTKTSDYFDMSIGYIESENEYYKYSFDKYFLLGDSYGIFGNSFNGKPLSKFLLAKKGDKYYFVENYKRDKISSLKYISTLKNKEEMLKMLSERAGVYYDSEHSSEIIEKIYNDTIELTKGLSKDEKIEAIYAFVLDKITYDVDGLHSGDKRVYSGLESYNRGKGVCDGYTRLMALMLSFAGIYDFEIKSGYPISDEGFRSVGHAWLKIGEYYYDPTYDDPVGILETREIDEYQYFKLPKDLYYIDRTDGVENVPDILKGKPLKFRMEYVSGRYFDYINKNGNNYKILNFYNNLQNLGVKSEFDLSKNNLKKTFKQAEHKDGTIYIDGKRINKYKYVKVKSNLSLKFVFSKLSDAEIEGLYYSRMNNEDILIYDVSF